MGMSADIGPARPAGRTARQARVPAAADQYFRVLHRVAEHPIITSEYTPGNGWVRQSYRKRVGRARCLTLQAQGAQAVVLSAGGRDADFQLSELVSTAGPKIKVDICAAGACELLSRTEWNPDRAIPMNPFISRYLFGCRKRGKRVDAVILYPDGEVSVRRNYTEAA